MGESYFSRFETHGQAEGLRRLAELVVPEPSQKLSFSCLSLHSLLKQMTTIVEYSPSQGNTADLGSVMTVLSIASHSHRPPSL